MSQYHGKNPQGEAQQMVDNWNLRFPVGTRVILKRGNQDFYTSTVSRAELLGREPVIQVEGIPGDYPLDRVKPQ